ncbi:hypothetical protein M011DRAFT_348347 [Sporormia fimetaria CBS 119925]|uniref:Heterokaryon incompatibility domain-containing protein n=1 Tax=Sporormia fimetaria CBS 119925 TaxID=1340428 RepID=A0A6A6VF38_9PLEO|nr:hypothetical protein M011DRAFT_348347 [Sporormia fimetaria CBS 119925]
MMDSMLPSRLLCHDNGRFFVFDPRGYPQSSIVFDIISYTWGDPVGEYRCDIEGVDWGVTIVPKKLDDIKRLMVEAGIRYLWADCVCINQKDSPEKSQEIARMFDYYKNARMCHILLDMPQVFIPLQIVDNLKFIAHIMGEMKGTTLASDAVTLTQGMRDRLTKWWTEQPWEFQIDQPTVRSAAVDMGILNCYSTSIKQVRTLFDHLYFKRVWTFQEMLLGKNITLWAINPNTISEIGEFHIWMDLATDSMDKALQLRDWITGCRELRTGAISAIVRVIEEEILILSALQTQVRGIYCARTDIINGGPQWWYENYKGISNVFSAISIQPRSCNPQHRDDIFKGLLGIFSGLFSAQEIETQMSGTDLAQISFTFFKQLSLKTGWAWTKLAISTGDRGEWDWIPVVENSARIMTTDCFSGVLRLGRLKDGGRTKTPAHVGIKGTPRKYMRIHLSQNEPDKPFHFSFRGCNAGKKIKTGLFSSEPIALNTTPRDIYKDETGRTLVQCATVLSSILDPAGNVPEFRRRLLYKLQPQWDITDPTAKPSQWVDRCVSGTFWEDPHPHYTRVHNMSMSYRFPSLYACESRLENENTVHVTCTVTLSCGCNIAGPFALIFEALTALEGSFLGDTSATLDSDNRIALKDGLGLVQVGDVGRTFHLVAFGGDVGAFKEYAAQCRDTKVDKPVVPRGNWPSGRALVREEFTHDLVGLGRDYGYVDTGGIGNLLVVRKGLLDKWRIVGVCIDGFMVCEKGVRDVVIR